MTFVSISAHIFQTKLLFVKYLGSFDKISLHTERLSDILQVDGGRWLRCCRVSLFAPKIPRVIPKKKKLHAILHAEKIALIIVYVTDSSITLSCKSVGEPSYKKELYCILEPS